MHLHFPKSVFLVHKKTLVYLLHFAIRSICVVSCVDDIFLVECIFIAMKWKVVLFESDTKLCIRCKQIEHLLKSKCCSLFNLSRRCYRRRWRLSNNLWTKTKQACTPYTISSYCSCRWKCLFAFQLQLITLAHQIDNKIKYVLFYFVISCLFCFFLLGSNIKWLLCNHCNFIDFRFH